jgi:hypothetical protein
MMNCSRPSPTTAQKHCCMSVNENKKRLSRAIWAVLPGRMDHGARLRQSRGRSNSTAPPAVIYPRCNPAVLIYHQKRCQVRERGTNLSVLPRYLQFLVSSRRKAGIFRHGGNVERWRKSVERGGKKKRKTRPAASPGREMAASLMAEARCWQCQERTPGSKIGLHARNHLAQNRANRRPGSLLTRHGL